MDKFTPEELAAEVWLPAATEPGYEVSNLGRVRSIFVSGRPQNDGQRRLRDTPKILTQNLAGKPGRKYRIVSIGQFRKVYVHQLVCSTFVAPRPGKMGCAHSDGNRFNNRPSNLSWKTQKDNEEDKKAHGTWFKRITNQKLTVDQIREIRSADISKRGSITRLAEKFGVANATICRLVHGKCWSHIP